MLQRSPQVQASSESDWLYVSG